MKNYRKIYWIIRFFISDLFNQKVQPQNNLTRWELFKSDYKFIIK